MSGRAFAPAPSMFAHVWPTLAFVGSKAIQEMVPLLSPRGVSCSVQMVVLVAVVPTVVLARRPEAVPARTMFEFEGATPMAVMEPVVIAVEPATKPLPLARLQEVAPLPVRHMERPAIQRRFGSFGSITKVVMKGNASPLMPEMRVAKLRPPFVDFRRERFVVSR